MVHPVALLICSHIIIQILQNYAVDSTQPGREGGLAAWGQRLAGVPWCLLQPAQGRTAWDIFGLAYLDWILILSRSSEPGAPLSKTNSSVIINQRIWTATRSVSVQAEKPKEPFCVEREMCGHMNLKVFCLREFEMSCGHNSVKSVSEAKLQSFFALLPSDMSQLAVSFLCHQFKCHFTKSPIPDPRPWT